MNCVTSHYGIKILLQAQRPKEIILVNIPEIAQDLTDLFCRMVCNLLGSRMHDLMVVSCTDMDEYLA